MNKNISNDKKKKRENDNSAFVECKFILFFSFFLNIIQLYSKKCNFMLLTYVYSKVHNIPMDYYILN